MMIGGTAMVTMVAVDIIQMTIDRIRVGGRRMITTATTRTITMIEGW